MNSPIRYYGGKGTMFNNILQEFPESGTFNMYIEPFGGSYTVGLKAFDGTTPMAELYNDLNGNVYALFKVLSDPVLYQEFKAMCDVSYYIEDLRDEYRKDLRRDDLSLVERAFKFFYVNRTSHNGNGGFSINTSIRRKMSKSVSDMLSAIDRFDELHERLSRVVVSKRDGVELIKKYSTENVFLYCDPPYSQDTRTGARYEVDMDNDKQEEFINACINSNAKILISGYDCELYKRLEEHGFKKISFEVKTVNTKMQRKTKTEFLWKNY